MRLQEIASSRKDLLFINPNLLQEEEGFNVRDDSPALQAHIRWLADSIKEKGVQQPLTIILKNNIPYIRDGHNRIQAVRLAQSEGCEIKAIPCRPEERFENEADQILNMITRNSGLPLTMLETSKVIKRLLAFGWNIVEVAQKTSFSPAHVNNLLSLLEQTPAVQEMVARGEVTATTVIHTKRKHGADTEKVLKQAKEQSNGKKITDKTVDQVAPVAKKDTNFSYWGKVFAAAIAPVVNAIDNDTEVQALVHLEKVYRRYLLETLESK